jgi:hypothetical protein
VAHDFLVHAFRFEAGKVERGSCPRQSDAVAQPLAVILTDRRKHVEYAADGERPPRVRMPMLRKLAARIDLHPRLRRLPAVHDACTETGKNLLHRHFMQSDERHAPSMSWKCDAAPLLRLHVPFRLDARS